MHWNWQLPAWPAFTYDPDLIILKERQFLLRAGSSCAFLKTIENGDYHHFVVEILSQEGVESSKIEGEILARESLQSSIRQHFGLKGSQKRVPLKESAMAHLLCDVYETYDQPLSHEMLCGWHSQLFEGDSDLEDLGKYRSHAEPMQIVSNRSDSRKVYFEAPPSSNVSDEMEKYVGWFNASRGSIPILGRVAIAHVYFESIHPFEDGNGRLGRVLVEKILSQEVGRPVLIAVSRVLEQRKKEYYAALERCNRTLQINHWVEFFADAVLQAQEESMALLNFLIAKNRLFKTLGGEINPRQEKVLLRMFEEGTQGFKGGLSAENYLSITKTSKATTTRDLADLVQKGALLKKGELRYARYFLNLN